MDDFIYFEFEIKLLPKTHVSDSSSKNNPSQDGSENLIILNVKDITSLIRNLKYTNDKLYLDAIEANYSHESMTPLNSIIANSRIVAKRFK